MFQCALICTDFTDGLHRLVNFVPSLAEAGLKKVIFFHNASFIKDREIPSVDEEAAEVARQRLMVAVEKAPAGLEVQVIVRAGRPIDNILQLANEHAADIILLGMPSRSLLNEKLFGSTSMGLAQRTSIPLMTLRPQLVSTYTTEELELRCRHLFRFFLVPYDDSKAAKYLVKRLQDQFVVHSNPVLQECLLYWVVEEGGRRELRGETRMQEAREHLRNVQQQFANALSIKVNAEVVLGDRVAKTLEAANDYDISAIATSSDSLGKLLEWSVPSFTGEILRKSWHPVIYFPPGRD